MVENLARMWVSCLFLIFHFLGWGGGWGWGVNMGSFFFFFLVSLNLGPHGSENLKMLSVTVLTSDAYRNFEKSNFKINNKKIEI